MKDNPLNWILSGDTGISSKAIWCVMMGMRYDEQWRHDNRPSDPSDFGRCYRLLKRYPEWRKRLNEVAVVFPKWKSMVEAWPKMERLYERDLATGKSIELFALMSELRHPSRELLSSGKGARGKG